MHIEHLKLYHSPLSRSTRVKWMLHEVLGDVFSVQRVNLYGAENYAPDFLRINPHHAVPVLEITWSDGSVQWQTESVSIVTFLAEAFSDAALAPPPNVSPQRVDYLQRMHFVAATVDAMLFQIRMHEHVFPEDQRDERTVTRYRKKFQTEVEPQLHERLAQSPFAWSDHFSAADCVWGHTVFWARGYGLCQGAAFERYMERLAQRPTFGKAFADGADFVLDARQTALARHFTG